MGERMHKTIDQTYIENASSSPLAIKAIWNFKIGANDLWGEIKFEKGFYTGYE